MNSYYETFIRKDMFPNDQSSADKLCDIYDQNPQEKAYIIKIIEWYIHGGSKYGAINMLKGVIGKVQRIEQTHSYLDQEYQMAMAK